MVRVAYQDRWHDAKVLAVSRDLATCTVRYEDNGYAEEDVPVATRLRQLQSALVSGLGERRRRRPPPIL